MSCILAADTRLQTANGMHPIESLAPSAVVWSDRQWVTVQITPTDRRACVRAHLSDGSVLDCSPETLWPIAPRHRRGPADEPGTPLDGPATDSSSDSSSDGYAARRVNCVAIAHRDYIDTCQPPGGLTWPRGQCASAIDKVQKVRDMQATLKHHGVSPTYVSEGALGTAILYLDDRTIARCAELGVQGRHRRLRRSQTVINVELIKNKCKSYLVTGPVSCAIAANNTMVCC